MCLAAYVRPTGLLVGSRPREQCRWCGGGVSSSLRKAYRPVRSQYSRPREKVRWCAVVCLAAYVRPNKKLTPDPPACKKLINDPAWEIRLDK